MKGANVMAQRMALLMDDIKPVIDAFADWEP